MPSSKPPQLESDNYMTFKLDHCLSSSMAVETFNWAGIKMLIKCCYSHYYAVNGFSNPFIYNMPWYLKNIAQWCRIVLRLWLPLQCREGNPLALWAGRHRATTATPVRVQLPAAAANRLQADDSQHFSSWVLLCLRHDLSWKLFGGTLHWPRSDRFLSTQASLKVASCTWEKCPCAKRSWLHLRWI